MNTRSQALFCCFYSNIFLFVCLFNFFLMVMFSLYPTLTMTQKFRACKRLILPFSGRQVVSSSLSPLINTHTHTHRYTDANSSKIFFFSNAKWLLKYYNDKLEEIFSSSSVTFTN